MDARPCGTITDRADRLCTGMHRELGQTHVLFESVNSLPFTHITESPMAMCPDSAAGPVIAKGSFKNCCHELYYSRMCDGYAQSKQLSNSK
jgi:hypothetical protein